MMVMYHDSYARDAWIAMASHEVYTISRKSTSRSISAKSLFSCLLPAQLYSSSMASRLPQPEAHSRSGKSRCHHRTPAVSRLPLSIPSFSLTSLPLWLGVAFLLDHQTAGCLSSGRRQGQQAQHHTLLMSAALYRKRLLPSLPGQQRQPFPLMPLLSALLSALLSLLEQQRRSLPVWTFQMKVYTPFSFSSPFANTSINRRCLPWS